MTGVFFSFEGVDGSGKSSQIKRLAAKISKMDREAMTTREPGGTEIAETLRDIFLKQNPLPMTQIFLLGAARYEHMQRAILPFLEKGGVVLCDRFADSMMAYQHYAKGVKKEIVGEVNRLAVQGRWPDKSFFFDLDPKIAQARLKGRGDKNPLDSWALEDYEKIRAGYLEIARKEPRRCVVLDAAEEEEKISEEIWRHAAPLLKRREASG